MIPTASLPILHTLSNPYSTTYTPVNHSLHTLFPAHLSLRLLPPVDRGQVREEVIATGKEGIVILSLLYPYGTPPHVRDTVYYLHYLNSFPPPPRPRFLRLRDGCDSDRDGVDRDGWE